MDYAKCPIDVLVNMVLNGERGIDELPVARRSSVAAKVEAARKVVEPIQVEEVEETVVDEPTIDDGEDELTRENLENDTETFPDASNQ